MMCELLPSDTVMFSTLWAVQEILEIIEDDKHEFCQCDLYIYIFLNPPDLQALPSEVFGCPKGTSGDEGCRSGGDDN